MLSRENPPLRARDAMARAIYALLSKPFLVLFPFRVFANSAEEWERCLKKIAEYAREAGE